MNDCDFSAIENWHPDHCKDVLKKMETSQEEGCLTFRKVRDLKRLLDNDDEMCVSNHTISISGDDIRLFKRLKAKAYVIRDHMQTENAIRKKAEERKGFTTIKNRRHVFSLRIKLDDVNKNEMRVVFSVSRKKADISSFFGPCYRVGATITFDDDEWKTHKITHCALDYKDVDVKDLPKEARIMLTRITRSPREIYELFEDV